MLADVTLFPGREAVICHNNNDLKCATYAYHPPSPVIGNASAKCVPPPLHDRIFRPFPYAKQPPKNLNPAVHEQIPTTLPDDSEHIPTSRRQ